MMHGRSFRELLVLSLGVFGAAYELGHPRPHGTLFLALYVATTLAGAARLWPARAVGMGVALGTLAQWLVAQPLREWPAYAWLNAVAVLLLASPALVARFDGAPSRLRWLPNPWAALPAGLATRLRVCLYALGVLVSLLCQQAWWSGELWGWVTGPLIIAALVAGIAALSLGRAGALAPIAGLALVLAARLATLAAAPVALDASARMFLGLALAAAATAAAVALPYALRLTTRRS